MEIPKENNFKLVSIATETEASSVSFDDGTALYLDTRQCRVRCHLLSRVNSMCLDTQGAQSIWSHFALHSIKFTIKTATSCTSQKDILEWACALRIAYTIGDNAISTTAKCRAHNNSHRSNSRGKERGKEEEKNGRTKSHKFAICNRVCNLFFNSWSHSSTRHLRGENNTKAAAEPFNEIQSYLISDHYTFTCYMMAMTMMRTPPTLYCIPWLYACSRSGCGCGCGSCELACDVPYGSKYICPMPSVQLSFLLCTVHNTLCSLWTLCFLRLDLWTHYKCSFIATSQHQSPPHTVFLSLPLTLSLSISLVHRFFCSAFVRSQIVHYAFLSARCWMPYAIYICRLHSLVCRSQNRPRCHSILYCFGTHFHFIRNNEMLNVPM